MHFFFAFGKLNASTEFLLWMGGLPNLGELHCVSIRDSATRRGGTDMFRIRFLLAGVFLKEITPLQHHRCQHSALHCSRVDGTLHSTRGLDGKEAAPSFSLHFRFSILVTRVCE